MRLLVTAPRVALLVLALSACQGGPRAVPPEQARQATPTFAPPFVPPPRTIDDVTAILDQERPDPARIARARARADRLPPKSADAATLARFYYARGLAASEVGRSLQQIADLTEAADWASRSLTGQRNGILYELGIAEFDGGNVARGLEYWRQAVRETRVPPGVIGGFSERLAPDPFLIRLHSQLAFGYAVVGDFERAEVSLRDAGQLYDAWQRAFAGRLDTTGVKRIQAGLARARGLVHRERGRYDEAVAFLREGIRLLASEPTLRNSPLFTNHLASLAFALRVQGRLVEAESEARKSLLEALARRGRYSTLTASALGILTAVIRSQGRYPEAERLARALLDIYQQLGTPPESFRLASARSLLGGALVGQSRWAEAVAEYEAIRTVLAGEPDTFERSFAGSPDWALALLNTGQRERACRMLQSNLRRRTRQFGEHHPRTAETRALVAISCFAPTDRTRVLRELGAAVHVLLDDAMTGRAEPGERTSADQRLAWILAAHIGLLADARGTAAERDAGVDAAAEAFRLADAARGQAVQRAIEASAARAAAGSPALADLVRRQQDAAAQVQALYGVLASVLSQPRDAQPPGVESAVREEIAAFERERGETVERIGREFPAYAELVRPRPATLAEARAALAPGEALVAIHVAADRSLVWATSRAGPTAFAPVPIGQADLRAMVARVRAALDPTARTLGDIPDFDVALAHRLYALLLEPVRAGWERARSLVVVPDGPLGQLPFALLPVRPDVAARDPGPLFSRYRAVDWLVRTHAVTTVPSAAALVRLRAQPASSADRRPFVGFGDPYFSLEQAARAREPAPVALLASAGGVVRRRAPDLRAVNSSRLALLPRLPDTGEEIRDVARTLAAELARDVYLGERANEHAVKTADLSRYRIIAFATHGLMAGDLDGLTQPALALSAPEVAGIEGDGLLTMDEILGLRLDADWVVLSACNTGAADGAGAEAVSGLGRAFFYAGSRALLVSHWPVETTSARALTTELFRRQQADPALTRAAALQATMNRLIDSGGLLERETGRMVFSYAHPLFWAAFALVGDGAGPSH